MEQKIFFKAETASGHGVSPTFHLFVSGVNQENEEMM